MAARFRVVLPRGGRTVSTVEVATATTPSSSSSSEAATVGFRLVVGFDQRYTGGEVGGVERVELEDVACRVPAGELMKRGATAVVDCAFEELVARMNHYPALHPEVGPEARKAATLVREWCAEEGVLGGSVVELCLRVVFSDSFEQESDPTQEDEEAGSDLEFDEESWERGGSEGVHWGYEHDDQGALDDDDDGQFSSRPYDGALVREGGPSDETLLLSGFEARSDGPELADQHELTSRDSHRLVRLVLDGGDVEGDEAYQRALAGGGGATVSHV